MAYRMGPGEWYTAGALVYGLARTLLAVHNADLRVYNHVSRKYEVRPVLPTEKAVACLVNMATAPIFTPFRLVSDIYSLDLAAHGRYELETGRSSRREFSSVFELVNL